MVTMHVDPTRNPGIADARATAGLLECADRHLRALLSARASGDDSAARRHATLVDAYHEAVADLQLDADPTWSMW